jgi:signal transduction histidine kinase
MMMLPSLQFSAVAKFWLLANLTIAGLRFSFCYYTLKHQNFTLRTEKIYSPLCSLQGILWGIVPYLFVRSNNLQEEILFFIVPVGLLIGYMSTSYSSLRASWSYSVAEAVPYVLYSISLNSVNIYSIELTIIFCCYLYYTRRSIVYAHTSLMENVMLTIQKEDMLTQLQRGILTEKKLKVEEITSINNAKFAALGVMAGGVAHEINNPLTIIQCHHRLLKNQCKKFNINDTKIQESLDVIRNSILRISTIVDSMKILRQKKEFVPKKLESVFQIVDEVLSLLRPRIENSGIKLEIGEFPKNINIECVKTEIIQVIMNLLLNAQDAVIAANSHKISLSGQFNPRQEAFSIFIEDDGVGLSQLDLKGIHDPFYTTKEVGKGMGLGLSIAKSLIEKNHGSIVVKSPHKPTIFSVTLPIYSPDKKTA